MMVNITARQLALRLENPFKLSYGTSTVRENVLVQIDDGTHTGVGEAAVVPYYHETPERILAYFSDPAVAAAVGDDPYLIEDALDRLPPAESPAARAAVDMALHDLWAQHLGQPLYRLWGLNPARIPDSSFTVAMADDETTYREHVRAARAYSLIKLKLGSGDWRTDWRTVQIAREETAAPLCVDANGGWSVEDSLAIIPRLAEIGIVFVEQPVARDNLAGWRALRESLPEAHPPLIADESVQGVESVPPLAGIADGINVKLAKCGGLRPARQMIMLARAYGMKVMIGCMVESSVAVTAAAQLAPLADFADLDGNLLITNDPYRGLQVDAGRVTLPDAPGLGVKPYAE
jgi:L-alanine-DL-glutamate epimerase-like enolase superfamily enzyme